MELFQPLTEPLNDKPALILLTAEFTWAAQRIFLRVCFLNKQIQRGNATLCDAKAVIFGFVTFLSLCRSNIWNIISNFIG